MTRRMTAMWQLLSIVLVIVGGRVLVRAADSPAGTRRPNIVFIFTDDHARQAIGAYGSRINTTPNLDRLASQGMLFRNCFCTNSVCAPSRAVILTGKHSHINGMISNRERFDGSQPTLPKLLGEAGYETAIIGKWHLKSDPTGFDHWEVLPGQGRYYNPNFLKPVDGKVETVTYTGYATDVITDLSIEWLKNRSDPSRPFLLMSQHKAPHRHFEPNLDHLMMYEDETIPEPPTLFDDYQGRTSAARMQTMEIARHMNARDLKLVRPMAMNDEQYAVWRAAYEPRNKAMRDANPQGVDLVRWKYQRYIKDYLRCVASVDDNVGRLMAYLEEAGLADNTVVVYSSDQGFYLGEHGWFDKRWMYEESLVMPLIVRWPGVVKPGSQSTDLVQNLDFAETFLEMAGVPIPADMQGSSLVPVLQGRTPPDWRRSIYYHYYEFPGWHDVRRHCGVRTDRYKLIHYYDIDEWELFDLQLDPHELRSAYTNPFYADVVKTMKEELGRLRTKYRVDGFQEPPVPPDPRTIKLELIVHYDAARMTDDRVPDQSGQGHDGERVNVASVAGRRGQAFAFDGKGAIQITRYPGSLDPTYRPFTVGAWCKPASGDGVVISHGEECFGYSLYLQDGRPHFNVQAGQNPYLVEGPRTVPLNEWVHLAATVDAEHCLTLWVDGVAVARLADAFLVSGGPLDGFSVGADIGTAAGAYRSPLGFTGLIEDARLYWGVLDEPGIKAWASK